MRIGRLAGMAWLGLPAAGVVMAQEQTISIALVDSQVAPFAMLAQAKTTAERIYSEIGIKVKWSSDPKADLAMQFDLGVAPEIHPGAMGYAMPYAKGGTCIHVLVDRVMRTESHRLAGLLLGHVMAHELGHVLEGVSRHSESGVMKAHWEDRDFDRMLLGPLSFSAEDVEWIRAGAAKRARRGVGGIEGVPVAR